MAAATSHFHLEDIAASREHYHLLLGEGAVDIPGTPNKIEAGGYEGFVTVELSTCEDDDPGRGGAKSSELSFSLAEAFLIAGFFAQPGHGFPLRRKESQERRGEPDSLREGSCFASRIQSFAVTILPFVILARRSRTSSR